MILTPDFLKLRSEGTAIKALLPRPKRLHRGGGQGLDLSGGFEIEAHAGGDERPARYLSEKLRALGLNAKTGGAKILLSGSTGLSSQGYELVVNESSAHVKSPSPQGLFYGVVTLLQLLERHGEKIVLPSLVIEDEPDLGIRGFSVDFRYAWLPEEHLLRIVDAAAALKSNAIVWWPQDKFAWKSHPDLVHARALTADQWKRVVSYGEQRYIQMIPLMDPYGHGETYLDRPKYLHLSNGEMGYWGHDDVQYCASHPNSWEIFHSLSAECLDVFNNTPYFHIGMDEVGGQDDHLCETCRARVRALASEMGDPEPFEKARNRFIAQRMVEAIAWIKARGRKAVFWDDTAINIKTRALGPGGIEIVSPQDSIPLLWYYDNSPAKAREALSRPGAQAFETWVGTSGWGLENIENYLKASAEFPNVTGAIATVWEQQILTFDSKWEGLSLALGLSWNRGSSGKDIRRAFGARIS